MKTSARNVFRGKVMNVKLGAVNDEIDVILEGSGTRITSVITSTSTKNLGLESEKDVVVLIKASMVILLADAGDVKFSARNQLNGVVVAIEEGAVNSEVRVRLGGGEMITAIITKESVKNLAIQNGSSVTALIKASHVILGVPA